MATLNKRKQAARDKVDSLKAYEVNDALGLVKEMATAKFPESVDVAVNLGVDPRKSDQVVRGSTVLPNGTGKSVRTAASIPALGQHGVNIMEFCKAFNAETQNAEQGMPIPVVISVYTDKSFTFITKTPPAAVLLKKAAGIQKGSGTPNTEKVGTVTRAQLEDIARTKEPDLNAADMDAAVKIIAGSARSMGLDVEGV